MKKVELIEKIAEETELPKKSVEKVIKSFTDNVTEIMANRDSLQLIGFGTFTTSERAARQGRNPKTGEVTQIPASTQPKLKFGKTVKEKVNKK